MQQSTRAKELFLRVYRATGSRELAHEAVDRLPATISRWERDDPAFRAAIDDIEAMRVDALACAPVVD